MKHIRLTLIILLAFNALSAQKKIEIPETSAVNWFVKRLPEQLERFHFKDLKSSKDSLNIRIWKRHEIFNLSCNNTFSSEFIIRTGGTDFVSTSHKFGEDISKALLTSFDANNMHKLKDDSFRGIDGSFIYIEIATKNKYKVVSYWSPSSDRSEDCKSLLQFLDDMHQAVNSKELYNTFLNSLPVGGYSWGMSSLRIERFLDDKAEKTDFYVMAERKIKRKLNIGKKTDHWKYPALIINHKPAKFDELNKYTKEDVVKFEILKPNNPQTSLYGTNGARGVIRVETKQ
ncbi:hypothetical protein [Marinifilum flexuosum]|uniref:Uncharacterized protein n=1 Tax=Marinifilum flexuosum TaxID=1117708 RepID=A0A419WF83_9BACT|nr:hypothetical protein [Marinifilum flexuosum]RKD94113.1 hypothetical protein BXY64_4276 [Marinifilum flexuosum]